MSIQISDRIRAHCSECGWSTEGAIRGNVERDVYDHEADHRQWEAVGRSLAGRVFVSEDRRHPWFGIVSEAQETARAHGYLFLTWNGWVYPVNDFSERSRLCMAKNLPEPVASR